MAGSVGRHLTPVVNVHSDLVLPARPELPATLRRHYRSLAVVRDQDPSPHHVDISGGDGRFRVCRARKRRRHYSDAEVGEM